MSVELRPFSSSRLPEILGMNPCRIVIASREIDFYLPSNRVEFNVECREGFEVVRSSQAADEKIQRGFAIIYDISQRNRVHFLRTAELRDEKKGGLFSGVWVMEDDLIVSVQESNFIELHGRPAILPVVKGKVLVVGQDDLKKQRRVREIEKFLVQSRV